MGNYLVRAQVDGHPAGDGPRPRTRAPENRQERLTPEAGDLNRDGHADIALTDAVGNLSLYRGTGDGAVLPMDNYAANAASVMILDFDRDGHEDVVVGSGRVFTVFRCRD